MGVTNLGDIDALISRAKLGTSLPSTPLAYYGGVAGQDFESDQWKGGELFYDTTNNELNIQTATSGSTTGTWRKLDTSFATTTSTSTSTSSSSSTSTSTSTSSSTSTSTSTSSTTTS